MTSITVNIPNEEIDIFKKMAEHMGWSFIIKKKSSEPCHESDINTLYKSIDNIHSSQFRNENHSALAQFISQISHELLTPVTELINNIDLTVASAERNPDKFSREQLITELHEVINRMMLFKYIVSDTEFIYSASEKNIQYNIVKQDRPQQILLDAIRLLEKEAHYKGLEIMTYISKMPPLYFDKERMMQVFLNLLKNAIRYSNSNTRISISYDYSGTNHEISFSNYGIGIQEFEKKTIFELFHRGEEAKKKFIRGTGMGLFIVRDIMKGHGGDCYVRRLNNPTEFVITLPIK